MKIYQLLLILSLFFISCTKQEWVLQTAFDEINLENNDDLATFLAFDDLYNNKESEAFEKFYALYQKTNEKFYAKEAFKLAFLIKDERIHDIAKDVRQMQDDLEITRLLIGYELMQDNIQSAKKLAQNLIAKDSKTPANYNILGSIYSLQNSKKLALQMFQKAYDLEQSEVNLIKLVEILENSFDEHKKAVNLTQAWVDKNGCTRQICTLLLGLYAKSADSKNVVKTYTKLYEQFTEDKFLMDALAILLYNKDLNGAKDLLENYHINEPILMEIYSQLGLLDEAYNLASKLYEKEKKPEFKARMAIYKYEKNGKNISKFELDQVVRLFEESTSKLEDGIYYNYYGYLLIDHDLDIKKGLELVKKANELLPDEKFIMDSVAWGYYKNNDCKTAKEWMEKIVQDKEFANTDEVKEHLKAINKCLLEQK